MIFQNHERQPSFFFFFLEKMDKKRKNSALTLR